MADGKIFHKWDGTNLTITTDSGTSTMNLAGTIGIRGPQGPAGKGIDGKDGYTPVKGVDYYTEEDTVEIVEVVGEKYYGAPPPLRIGQVDIDEEGNDSYPALELIERQSAGGTVLASDKFVTERGNPHFLYSKSWKPNAFKLADSSVGTIYAYPKNQTQGEIFLPLYGISQGPGQAKENSAIMARLLDNTYSTTEFGITFILPVGHYYFTEPIDLTNKQASLIGFNNTTWAWPDLQGATWLHFPTLSDEDVAIKTNHGTVRDLNIVGGGNGSTSTANDTSGYALTFTRGNSSNSYVTTISERNDSTFTMVKAIGLSTAAGAHIENVTISNFYFGLWAETSNVFITNAYFNECYCGLSVDCDAKIQNIQGTKVMKLLQIRGSVSSAVGVRGDSVGEHLVEIMGGANNISLYDLDADFCMKAIVAIGTDETKSPFKNMNSGASYTTYSAGTVSDLAIHNIHGRHAVSHAYAGSSSPFTLDNLTSDIATDCGLITIRNGNKINGAIITAGQSKNKSPFDGDTKNHTSPFALLTAEINTEATGIQFITSSNNIGGNELLATWAKKVIRSFSTAADACKIRLLTPDGIVTYTNANGAVVIKGDTVDLSNYVQKGEAVVSVNGIAPDDLGNVNTTELAPIEVSNITQCVDTSRKYVIDNYIYSYLRVFIPAGTLTSKNWLPESLDSNLTDIYNEVGYKENVYCNSSGVEQTHTGTKKTYLTGLIPCQKGSVIRINAMNFMWGEGYNKPSILFHDSSGAPSFTHISIDSSTTGIITHAAAGNYLSYDLGANQNGYRTLSNIEFTFCDELVNGTLAEGQTYYIRFKFYEGTLPANVVITVDEEIVYSEEDGYGYAWKNTGVEFVDTTQTRLADLEARVAALEGN